MANAQNIVLSNHANVGKTFSVATGANGNMPALFELREGANRSVYPRLEISAKKNGNSDARKVRVTMTVPQPVVDATGLTRKASSVLFALDVVLPDSISAATREDAIAFFGSLMFNPELLDTLATGYAPT